MRIISGKFRGHRFHPPADRWPTRPTTDISKEGLFNMLQNRIDFEQVKMLDLFGGTGNHCFEFVSRGCMDVTYVDKHRPAHTFVKKQIAHWNIESEMNTYLMDVKHFIKRNVATDFDYIFAGPPYPLPWLDKIPQLIFDSKLLANDGLFVMEHNPDHNFEQFPQFVESRNYGQTIFAFFEYLKSSD